MGARRVLHTGQVYMLWHHLDCRCAVVCYRVVFCAVPYRDVLCCGAVQCTVVYCMQYSVV